MMKLGLMWVLFAVVLSCRPFPVAVVNRSADTVEVQALCTEHFRDGKDSGQTRFLVLAPGDSLHCGFATAGLGDEIPFARLNIFKRSDTITAIRPLQVLDLFERNRWGYLATPYVLAIRE